MRLTTDRINLLLTYGLTEYQARAYLALLESPMTSAGTLARLSHVPRNRLYGVLEDLQELGLVEIHLGEKRQYQALRFSNYLEKRKKGLVDKVKEIEERQDYLDAVLEPAPADDAVHPEAGVARVLRGRRAIREEIDRMLDRAKESVILVLTPGSAPRYEPHLNALSAKAAELGGNLSVEVHIPPECYGNGTAERFERILPGCIVPLPNPRHGILHLVDGQEMLYVQPIPDDRKGSSTSDFGFYTTNRAMTQDLVDLLGGETAAWISTGEKSDPAEVPAHGPEPGARLRE